MENILIRTVATIRRHGGSRIVPLDANVREALKLKTGDTVTITVSEFPTTGTRRIIIEKESVNAGTAKDENT